MKIKHLLPVAIAAVATMPSMAQTISQVVSGGTGVEVLGADGNKGGLWYSSTGVNVVTTQDILGAGTITVQGFYNGNFDVDFHYKLTGFYIKEGTYNARETKPDGTPGEYVGKQLKIQRVIKGETKILDAYFTPPTEIEEISSILPGNLFHTLTREANDANGYDMTIGLGNALDSELVATVLDAIVQNSDAVGDIIPEGFITAAADYIVFYPGAIRMTVIDPETGETTETHNFDRYMLSTYTANSVMTDTRSNVNREYPIRANVVTNPDNTLSIDLLNFSNSGFTLKKVAGDDQNPLSMALGTIRLDADLSTNSFSIEPGQDMYIDNTLYPHKGDGNQNGSLLIQGHLYKPSTLFGAIVEAVPNTNDKIYGNITYNPGEFTHSGSNMWEKEVPGGDFSRTQKFDMEFNFTDKYSNYFAVTHTPIVSNSRFALDFESNMAHDVKIADAMGSVHGNGMIYMIVDLVPGTVDAASIRDYDIVVRHGKEDEIKTGLFSNNYDETVGLEEATVLTEAHMGWSNGVSKIPALVPSTNGNQPLYLTIPVSELTNHNKKPLNGSQPDIANGDNMQVWVRTNYNDGSASTFHALTTFQLSSNNATGIEGIEGDTATGDAIYFNLQGVEVPADALTPGVYVKKQGDVSTKVIIK